MRPLRERLRYIELRGTLRQDGNEWVWIAAPDTRCEIRELRNKSRFAVVEYVYDILKGIRI